jgi:hypothetical protein
MSEIEDAIANLVNEILLTKVEDMVADELAKYFPDDEPDEPDEDGEEGE